MSGSEQFAARLLAAVALVVGIAVGVVVQDCRDRHAAAEGAP